MQTLILAGIVALVSFVVWRAPEIHDEWRHYRCLKRHGGDAEQHKNALAALGEAGISRARLREYLKANHPDLPVQDEAAGVRAGTLFFASDGDSGTVSYVPQPMACPEA